MVTLKLSARENGPQTTSSNPTVPSANQNTAELISSTEESDEFGDLVPCFSDH